MKHCITLIFLIALIFSCQTNSYDVIDSYDDPPEIVTVQLQPDKDNMNPDTGLTLYFSCKMDKSSVKDATSLVQYDAVTEEELLPLVPIFEWMDSKTVEISIPQPKFKSRTKYVLRVETSAKDVMDRTMALPYVLHFTTGAREGEIPDVSEIYPADDEEVPSCLQVDIKFSRPMNIQSVTENLSITNRTTGSITNYETFWQSSTQISCVFDTNLVNENVYEVKITDSTRDYQGNSLLNSFTSSFTINNELDTAAPKVVSTVPLDNSSTHNASDWVKLYFDRQMDFESLRDSITVNGEHINNGDYEAYWDASKSFCFRPKSISEEDKNFTVRLETEPVDLCGNKGSLYEFSYQAISDLTPPQVMWTLPSQGDSEIGCYDFLKISFDEPMMQDINNITSWNYVWRQIIQVKVDGNSIPLAGTFSWETSDTIVYSHHTNWNKGKIHSVYISEDAEDISGNNLETEYNFSFVVEDECSLQVPSAPFDLEAITIEDTKICLTWECTSSVVSSFNIFKAIDTTNTSYVNAGFSFGEESYCLEKLLPSTDYLLKVKAVNPAGESEFSDTLSVRTKLDVSPPSLMGYANSDSTLFLFWNTINNADSYRLIYGTSSANMSNEVQTTNSTYQLMGLTPSTLYHLSVSAIIDGEETNSSDVLQLETHPSIPLETVATASPSGENDILVEWNAVSDAEEYYILVGTNTCGSNSLYMSIESTATETTLNNMAYGNNYNIEVKAKNITGESGFSNCISVYIPKQQPDLFLNSLNDARVELVWIPISSSSGHYDIFSGTSDTNLSVSGSVSGTNTYKTVSLAGNVDYYFAVQWTSSSNDYSYQSITQSITTSPVLPASPVISNVKFLSNSTCSVEWNSDPNVDTYNIYAGDMSGTCSPGNIFLVESPVSGTGSQFDTTSLLSYGQEYCFYVSGSNASGEGNLSSAFDKKFLQLPDGTGEFCVNISSTSNYQQLPAVALSDTDNFVVTWKSNTLSPDLYAQRFDSTGTFSGNMFMVNSSTSMFEEYSEVDIDNQNRFVAAWQIGGPNTHTYARTYDSLGNPTGTEIDVNGTSNFEFDPAVAMNKNTGDFIVTWRVNNIHARKFNFYGTASGSAFTVNTSAGYPKNDPDVAIIDNLGNFVVVWEGVGSSDNDGIYARKFDINCSAYGDEVSVNTYIGNEQSKPRVAVDSSGNCTVVWQSNGQDGSGFGIYGQQFDSNLNPLGSEFQINDSTSGNQSNPKIAMDEVGNFCVVWDGSGASDTDGIYAKFYNSNGISSSSEFLVNTYTNNTQSYPDISMNSSGNLVIVWQSYRQVSSSSDDDIFARRYGWENP